MQKNRLLKSTSIALLLCSQLSAASLGSLLFHGNCTTCHFETKTVSAPAVIDFREHYIRAFPKREDFVNYMSAWVANPDAKTSIMLQAIEEHGLMPQLGFDEEVLKDITGFIYDTDFTKEHEGDPY
ncbi:MAG: cytochrome C [Campylobacterota bacterium]|nr:cytochrome C [Campylobacterota bacterium]